MGPVRLGSPGSLLRRFASDWKVKTLSQKVLGLLPGDLSFRANEWVVRRLRGSGLERVEIPARVAKGLSNVSLLRRRLGVDLAGANVLELGTGWHGIDLVLFHLAGADRIYTIDRFPFLTSDALARAVGAVCRSIEAGGVEEDLAWLLDPDRCSRLLGLHSRGDPGVSWFRELNIDYFTVRADRWPSVRVPRKTIDLVYSESVLQRLPADCLRDVIECGARQWMRDGGAFFHRTDQKDIHTLGHADEERWPLEYLKYPDWLFNTFLNGSLMYQNRFRESDFLRLFAECGLRVAYLESLRLPRDVERIRATDLAPRFRGYSAEDLATRSSRFVGSRDARADGRVHDHRIVSSGDPADG